MRATILRSRSSLESSSSRPFLPVLVRLGLGPAGRRFPAWVWSCRGPCCPLGLACRRPSLSGLGLRLARCRPCVLRLCRGRGPWASWGLLSVLGFAGGVLSPSFGLVVPGPSFGVLGLVRNLSSSSFGFGFVSGSGFGFGWGSAFGLGFGAGVGRVSCLSGASLSPFGRPGWSVSLGLSGPSWFLGLLGASLSVLGLPGVSWSFGLSGPASVSLSGPFVVGLFGSAFGPGFALGLVSGPVPLPGFGRVEVGRGASLSAFGCSFLPRPCRPLRRPSSCRPRRPCPPCRASPPPPSSGGPPSRRTSRCR